MKDGLKKKMIHMNSHKRAMGKVFLHRPNAGGVRIYHDKIRQGRTCMSLTVWEDDEKFRISISTPGLDKDSLSVRGNEDELIIEGLMPLNRRPDDLTRPSAMESGSWVFEKRIQLSTNVHWAEARGRFDKDRITIEAPKDRSPQVRPVKVNFKNN